MNDGQNNGRYSHGMVDTPTYKSWLKMKGRCNNASENKWHLYGGKGISYDPRWEKFENFLADMGERPEGKTLDRREGALGYNKSNCRWATPLEQGQNVSVHTDNSLAVRGVAYHRGRYTAEVCRAGIRTKLYTGKDFFEACCARKSFDAQEMK